MRIHWRSLVQRRPVILGALALLLLTGLGGTGYALARAGARSTSHTASAAALAGLRPVAQAHPAFLAVVSSDPAAGSTGVPVDKPVTMTFNLAVDPAALATYFTVLPQVPGSFAAGKSAQEVVWKPNQAFAAGAGVNIVIRKGFPSLDGFSLGDDFTVGYQTAAPATGVMFQSAGQVLKLVNLQAGQSVSVTLGFGNQVPPAMTLTTYRASSADLLRSLVHDAQGQLANGAIDTGSMQALDHKDGARNGDTEAFTEPDGIYAIVAGNGQTQYGALWLDVSRKGVLLRQDDQKVVVAGEDLATGSTSTGFRISFYNLQDGVHLLESGAFTGSGEFPARYPSGIDVAVAGADGEEVLVPVSVPESNADLKLVSDLSQQPQLFITTDRGAYQKGDTIKFAGAARLSNDQAYTTQPGMKVTVSAGQPAIAQQVVEVAADGTFSGSMPMPDQAFSADGSPASLALFASAGSTSLLSPVFTVVQAVPGGAATTGRLTVTFDKPTYFAGDTITATISGAAPNGAPLAGQALSLGLYAAKHDAHPGEVDSFAQPSFWGAAVQTGIHGQLDASGRATYSFPANVAKNVIDQEVTLTASLGSGAATTVGARTAVVYQAADELFLLPSRGIYQTQQPTLIPLVVETHDGSRVRGAALSWELDKTDYQGQTATVTPVGSGSLTTDATGMAVVRTTYGSPQLLTLKVTGRDAAGNGFEAERSVSFASDPAALTFFGTTDQLQRLDVTADKIAYAPGDDAHLTVHSTAAVTALLSLERGRIHRYEWVKLAAGDNPLTIKVTNDLAPGFNVLFSYFQDGVYVNEGLPIAVGNRGRLLKVTLTPSRPPASAPATASASSHVLVSVTDASGAPVAATLTVDAYDAAMSAGRLVDQPSLPRAFLTPAVRGTDGSSSLLGIGMGGGRCGGGDSPFSLAAAYPGRLVAWQPALATDGSGHAEVDLPVAAGGPVRLSVMASTGNGLWGQAEVDVSAS